MVRVLLLLALLPAVAVAQEENEESDDPIVVGETDEPPEFRLPEAIVEPLVALPRPDDALSYELPAPQDVGGLSVLPLEPDEDLRRLMFEVAVGEEETILLVSGQPADRYAVDDVRLQLPPPFLVVGLDHGVHMVRVLRSGAVHAQRVRCVDGHLTLFDTEAVLSSKPDPEQEEDRRQRELLAELLVGLEEGEDVVAKIRQCMTFLEENPDGEAADQARTILSNLRQRLDAHSTVEMGDDIPTEELRERQRLEAIATAPRPPGTRSRQTAGIALAGGAVGLTIAALAMDGTASDAAEQYHHLRLTGDDIAAAPYLHQAQINEDSSRVCGALAVVSVATAAAVLIADGALRAHWKRLRREIGDDGEEDGSDLALVPTPGGLALVGRW
jgi:hypothetical protein